MEIKDIQLCGLGNSLVDIQLQVSNEEFLQLQVIKGEMRLVDSTKHNEILQFLGNRQLNKCSGGSAANTIIAFSQMGGSAAYKTTLGNDANGRFYAGEFNDLNIALQAKMLDDEQTGICLILITPDSERTMLTSLAATAKYSKEHIDKGLIARSEWLYLEGYRFSNSEGTEAVDYAIDIAKRHNTHIALTFSDVFIVNAFRENLKKTIDNADLIFCNEQEAIAYTGASNSEEAFDILSEKVPNIVITLGKNGSIIKWQGELAKIPSYNVQAIDTTGAGDMFAAGFLYGIYRWNDAKIAGHFASLASARIVSQLGARFAGSFNSLIEEINKKFR